VIGGAGMGISNLQTALAEDRQISGLLCGVGMGWDGMGASPSSC
jgi:hypothetical protein